MRNSIRSLPDLTITDLPTPLTIHSAKAANIAPNESFPLNTIYGGTLAPARPAEEPFLQRSSYSAPTSETAQAETSHWSTSLQNLLEHPPSALPYRLIVGGMAFCTAFGVWAWFGQIEEVGKAQGRLIPQGEIFKIHPTELGRVATLSVREGQTVQAGQIIAELDHQLAMSEIERLKQGLMADQMQLQQTLSLIDRTRLEGQLQIAIASADARAQEAAIAQAQANINTTQELLVQAQTDTEAQNARLERLSPLLAEGAISRERIFEVEQALRDRQSEQIRHQGILQQSLAETEQLRAGLTEKQAQEQAAQVETQKRVQQLEVEVTRIKAKMAETQTLITQAQAKLDQRFLTAPVSGVISALNVRNSGEVVQPGQTVAEIVPLNAPLVLSAVLPNREAGFVKAGMPVQIKMDAYPFQDYGVIPGQVVAISPDARLDEKLGAVYQVEVALDRTYLKAQNQSIAFKPGQTATADIVIRRRRIADILLDPLKQLQQGGISL